MAAYVPALVPETDDPEAAAAPGRPTPSWKVTSPLCSGTERAAAADVEGADSCGCASRRLICGVRPAISLPISVLPSGVYTKSNGESDEQQRRGALVVVVGSPLGAGSWELGAGSLPDVSETRLGLLAVARRDLPLPCPQARDRGRGPQANGDRAHTPSAAATLKHCQSEAIRD